MKLLPPLIKQTILQHTKEKKNIIYGGQAVNRQLPLMYYRPSHDWDIWSSRHRKDAYDLERKLDKMSGGDNYYTKRLRKVYVKSVYSVFERPRHKIADFAETPPGSGIYKVIGNIRWQTLKDAKKKYQGILDNPQLAFRHDKALWDLWRIEQFEKQLKRRKQTSWNMLNMFEVKVKNINRR